MWPFKKAHEFISAERLDNMRIGYYYKDSFNRSKRNLKSEVRNLNRMYSASKEAEREQIEELEEIYSKINSTDNLQALSPERAKEEIRYAVLRWNSLRVLVEANDNRNCTIWLLEQIISGRIRTPGQLESLFHPWVDSEYTSEEWANLNASWEEQTNEIGKTLEELISLRESILSLYPRAP